MKFSVGVQPKQRVWKQKKYSFSLANRNELESHKNMLKTCKSINHFFNFEISLGV